MLHSCLKCEVLQTVIGREYRELFLAAIGMSGSAQSFDDEHEAFAARYTRLFLNKLLRNSILPNDEPSERTADNIPAISNSRNLTI